MEKEACKISYKDGSVFVRKEGGNPIEVLAGMDKSLYVDSADSVNMFLGMKTDREAAQHEVTRPENPRQQALKLVSWHRNLIGGGRSTRTSTPRDTENPDPEPNP